VNSTIFMLLWGITGVSLVWMYWTEIVPARTHRTRIRAVPQPA
jgi:NNP family nitrate/nitrite transporter-like MFS transporter